MHTVKNTSEGPRFFSSGAGTVHLQPGETSEPVKIADADLEAMKAAGHFEVEPAKSHRKTEADKA